MNNNPVIKTKKIPSYLVKVKRRARERRTILEEPEITLLWRASAQEYEKATAKSVCAACSSPLIEIAGRGAKKIMENRIIKGSGRGKAFFLRIRKTQKRRRKEKLMLKKRAIISFSPRRRFNAERSEVHKREDEVDVKRSLSTPHIPYSERFLAMVRWM